ncbi:hypothetical protein ACLOJK_019801 [Asimina triloba]
MFWKIKDSMIKPITKILASIALVVLLLAVFVRETPIWMKTSNFLGVNFPPWILACIVILFMRLRKRTKDVFNKFGCRAGVVGIVVVLLHLHPMPHHDMRPLAIPSPCLVQSITFGPQAHHFTPLSFFVYLTMAAAFLAASCPPLQWRNADGGSSLVVGDEELCGGSEVV